MKRTLISLLFLATLPALGQQTQNQSQPQSRPKTFVLNSPESFGEAVTVFPGEASVLPENSSAKCEESIVHASFNRPARFMLVAASNEDNEHKAAPPVLSVQVANHNTKPVKAVDLIARLKVKENRYQLDSVTREYPLHLSKGEGSEQLQLVESAVGFIDLSIEQVTYSDGTTWKPEQRACSFRSTGGSVLIAK